MQMLKDILTWLAQWSRATMNIKMQETHSATEVIKTAITKHISQPVVATSTAVHHLFVRTVVANAWVRTLLLVVKKREVNYGTKKIFV